MRREPAKYCAGNTNPPSESAREFAKSPSRLRTVQPVQPQFPEYDFPSKRSPVPVVAGSAAACVLLVLVWGLSQRKTKIKAAPPSTLTRIRNALANVHFAQTTSWNVLKGKRIPTQRSFYAMGRWRVEYADGDIRIRNEQGSYELAPGQAKPTYFRSGLFSAIPTYGPFSFGNLDQAGDVERSWVVTPVYKLEGRTYFQIVEPLAMGQLRLTCTIDAKTFLPIRLELQHGAPGTRWTLVTVTEATYGISFEAWLFDPNRLKSLQR